MILCEVKMKVITIKEPFATLIKEGIKKYEFRTWKTSYRGEVLIHAGKGIDKKAMKKYAHLNLKYQSGCIIAKAQITDCILIDDAMRKKLEEENMFVYKSIINDKAWKGYGFKLENVESIDKIEINGQLGLWNYDYTDEVK